jgi:hypothetical protein
VAHITALESKEETVGKWRWNMFKDERDLLDSQHLLHLLQKCIAGEGFLKQFRLGVYKRRITI